MIIEPIIAEYAELIKAEAELKLTKIIISILENAPNRRVERNEIF